MDINSTAQSVAEVALSIDEITSWVIKIIGTLAGVIVALAGVVVYLFKTLIADKNKLAETQLAMQKETNRVINDNTVALNGLSAGLKAIPDHIETVLKLHLMDRK